MTKLRTLKAVLAVLCVLAALGIDVHQGLAAAPSCKAEAMAPSAAFVESQAYLDKALARFANDPSIAAQADATLSKLLAAKSPAIVQWMRARDYTHKKEEDVVREWRVYYAKMFVLAKYPHAEPAINSLIEKMLDDVFQRSMTKPRRSKLESLFAQARDHALKRVGQLEMSAEGKKAITARLKGIKLYWMPTFKNSKFTAMPLEALSWGIAYDPVPNEINMGIEALKYPNDETTFAVFAHEIGHSFDSCRWGAFFSGSNPFAGVIACLRDSKSVAAKIRDDSKLDEALKAGKLDGGLYAGLKANPTCNKAQYPPLGTQADQIPESFADWFSAEVASISPYVTQNLRSDLCETHKLNAGSSYPPNEARRERIYLAHPQIRKTLKLDADSEIRYCAPPGAG